MEKVVEEKKLYVQVMIFSVYTSISYDHIPFPSKHKDQKEARREDVAIA